MLNTKYISMVKISYAQYNFETQIINAEDKQLLPMENTKGRSPRGSKLIVHFSITMTPSALKKNVKLLIFTFSVDFFPDFRQGIDSKFLKNSQKNPIN